LVARRAGGSFSVTPAEEQEFYRMIRKINILYLSGTVYALVDVSTPSRFWTCLEIFLSLMEPTPRGLWPAPPARQRCIMEAIHNADNDIVHHLMDKWSDSSVADAHKILALPDVCVTNAKDKEKQLEKLVLLDARVRQQCRQELQHAAAKSEFEAACCTEVLDLLTLESIVLRTAKLPHSKALLHSQLERVHELVTVGKLYIRSQISRRDITDVSVLEGSAGSSPTRSGWETGASEQQVTSMRQLQNLLSEELGELDVAALEEALQEAADLHVDASLLTHAKERLSSAHALRAARDGALAEVKSRFVAARSTFREMDLGPDLQQQISAASANGVSREHAVMHSAESVLQAVRDLEAAFDEMSALCGARGPRDSLDSSRII
jgi:hypothetical protein